MNTFSFHIYSVDTLYYIVSILLQHPNIVGLYLFVRLTFVRVITYLYLYLLTLYQLADPHAENYNSVLHVCPNI